MKKTILIFSAAFALTAAGTQYSKLAIITAAKERGKWGDLKSWIASAGMMDEWQACDYISDDHPLFASVTNAIVTTGFATADEVEGILSASKDPAVSDALLRRVYAADMEKAEGRRRWHGKVVSTVYDTNALIRIQRHESGFVYESPFSPSRPGSIESQLSAAERAAQAEAAKKERERLAEEKRQARIAELTTNLTACVQAVMEKKTWPEDLARLYLQHELNTLVGTNTVTVTVAPE